MHPSETEIQRVMAETGMQYAQARNHLIGKALLLERLQREQLERRFSRDNTTN